AARTDSTVSVGTSRSPAPTGRCGVKASPPWTTREKWIPEAGAWMYGASGAGGGGRGKGGGAGSPAGPAGWGAWGSVGSGDLAPVARANAAIFAAETVCTGPAG